MSKKKLDIKLFFKENIIIITSILIMLIIQIFYLYNATKNVPIMDSWRAINEIADKVFSNNLKFEDLWKSSSAHRNPLFYLLLAINMKYFSLNTQVDIFLGAIVLVINCIILYNIYNKKILKGLQINIKVGQLLFVIIIATVFNFNQWEILTQPFSFIFTLRIMTYLLIFNAIDYYLLMEQKNALLAFVISIAIFAAICILSQGYFVSMVVTVFLIILFNFIISYKKDGTQFIKYYLVVFLFSIFGSYLYLNGLISSVASSNSFGIFIGSLFNGDFINGVIIMLGRSVLPFELVTKLGGINVYYAVGMIILVSYLFAVFIYFKSNMHKKTYVPLMLISYSCLSIAVIIYGRMNSFNLEYLAASRYVCETTFGLIGMLFIFVNYFILIRSNNKIESKKSQNTYIVINNIIVGVIILLLSISAFTEIRTAPYRKIYEQNLIDMLLNLENKTDDELVVFQAGKPDYVRHGALLMKKYHLGVFSEKYINELNSKEIPEEIINGIYEDGWIEKKAQFKVRTGREGMIVLTGYYPYEITGNETGMVYIEGQFAKEFIISENNFVIDLKTMANSDVTILIENDFDFKANSPDVRRLSFIISSIESK